MKHAATEQLHDDDSSLETLHNNKKDLAKSLTESLKDLEEMRLSASTARK